MSGSVLALVPSVHVIHEGATLRVDDKFAEGLALHARQWGGPVRLLIRRGTAPLPFARSLRPADLGVDLRLLDPDERVTAAHLRGVAVTLASADDAGQLDLRGACDAAGSALVYAVEYDFRTRLTIARLDLARRPLRLLRSWQWLAVQERRRRRALGQADGVQANGYPAAAAYGGLARNLCIYLDGRMRTAEMADAADMAARRARLARGAPIRLVHAGRLEPMKGAGDLVPVMAALQARGIAATLDIFGAGSLAGRIARAAAGMAGRIRLHAPVDFHDELVPFMRREADVFLAVHRQSDPSCAYLEAMGCGLAVMGARNAMWTPLNAASGAGWEAPMGKPEALAKRLAGLQEDEIAAAGERALAFARNHDFEGEFARRMEHLRGLARR